MRIREPVDSVRARCTVVGDTVLRLEGQEQPAIRVALGGDTVLIEIVDGRVWRMTVRSPGLRTADSTGVGTPIRTLVADSGAIVARGDGGQYVLSPAHCGLSFEIAGLPARRAEPGRTWTARELATMPDSVRVGEVLVTGACHTPAGLRVLWDTTAR